MAQTPAGQGSNLRRRVVMSLVAAVAIGGFVYVGLAPSGDRLPSVPSAIESVFPQGGNLELRQTAIYADLAPGYTGNLRIDGEEVVDDDLQIVDAINTVALKPQPDSRWAEIPPGRHCASIEYREIGRPRSQSNSYTWCFNLH